VIIEPYFLLSAYWDETSMGHEGMKRIVDGCESYRQVQDILTQSIETAFKDEIWDYEQQAKKIERAERKLEDSHEYVGLFIG